MGSHYLLYWKVTDDEVVDITQFKRTYAAGGQLNRVKTGDTLWIINLRNNTLYLIGRIRVSQVVEGQVAARKLLNTDEEMWDGQYYAIAEANSVERMKWVNIDHIAEEFRFISSTGKDRLSLIDGAYSPMQFRAMRELTPESANLLSGAWYSEEFILQTIDEYLVDQDTQTFIEGESVLRTIVQRRRNQSLVQDKKRLFKHQFGELSCEVCGFNFIDVYGIEFIEAHHMIPISSGERRTTIEDIVLLCANCHRVVHSQNPPMDLEELSRRINQNKT